MKKNELSHTVVDGRILGTFHRSHRVVRPGLDVRPRYEVKARSSAIFNQVSSGLTKNTVAPIENKGEISEQALCARSAGASA